MRSKRASVARAVSVASALGFAIAACEKIAHVGEFETRAASVDASGFQGVCNACPADAGDLRRPPCPTASAASAADDGVVYSYAWRRLHMGAKPEEWRPPNDVSYAAGMDQDCSTRPNHGLPVLCAAILEDGGDLDVPWEPLPHGIDNSLGQRVIYPLALLAQSLGQTIDFEDRFNTQLEAAHGSVLINVYEWNGTDEDDQVGVSMSSAYGIVDGAPPRWDGTDPWVAVASGVDNVAPGVSLPLTGLKTHGAYVTGGILVAEFPGRPTLTLFNNGARLSLPVTGFYYVARVGKDMLADGLSIARWSVDDFERSVPDIADYLSGCAKGVARSILIEALPRIGRAAADLPEGDAPTPGTPCGAISIAWGADAVRVRIGEIKAPTDLIAGCP